MSDKRDEDEENVGDEEEETEEEGASSDQEEAEMIDPEIVALREEIEQLEARIQEEKALSDKAEAARRIAQEQSLSSEEQFEQKTKELAQLEEESAALMVEGRMYQLASREYDFPLKEAWQDKPEQALVVDLSKIVRNLEQAIRSISTRSASEAGSGSVLRSEIEVVHVRVDGSEVSKTNIPIKANTTMGEILRTSCAYWSIDPETCEIENSQGRKLVRRDGVPADTVQLVLKDRVNDRALEDEKEDRQSDGISDDGGDGGGHPPTNLIGDASDGSMILSDQDTTIAGVGESVQVGRDSITKRDSRFCHHFEFLVIILLATTFVAMSLEFRRVFEAFQARQVIKQLFGDQPVINSNQLSFTFDEIASEDKMWQWIEQAGFLFAASQPLTSNCTIGPNVTFVFSGMTLSQLRMPPNTNCASVTINGISQPCFSNFVSPQTVVPFAQVPSDPLVQAAFVFNATSEMTNETACTAWPVLVSDTFPGLYEFYPARQLDFYSLLLSRPVAQYQIQTLSSSGWIDPSTRLVTLEFTALDQSTGAIVNVIAAFEYLPNGAVLSSWISIPLFSQVNDNAYDLALLILTLILILMTIVYYLLSGFRNHGSLFLDALILIFIGLYYAGNGQVGDWVDNCQSFLMTNQVNKFDFRGVAFQSQLVGNFIGIIVVLFAIRLGKHLDSSPSSSKILRSLMRAFPQYVSLIFLVVVLVSCFALMAHFIFGRYSNGFFVADLAYASLWISFTTGNSGAYVGVAHWGAIVLSLAAYIVLFLVLLFMCFAVTVSAYISVSDEVRSRGYFWLAESRATTRYATEVVATSGAIKGKDAESRQKSFRGARRTYGS